MEDRLEILETRLAYQDQTVEALNEVVTRQQDQIDRLERELQALRDVLDGTVVRQSQACELRSAS
jgi:SlyX protein